MYSLVKSHNDNTFSVILSKNISSQNRKYCIVKCEGRTYAASIVAKNHDKSVLLETKRKQERVLSNRYLSVSEAALVVNQKSLSNENRRTLIASERSSTSKFSSSSNSNLVRTWRFKSQSKEVVTISRASTQEKFDEKCNFFKNEKTSKLTSKSSPPAKSPSPLKKNLLLCSPVNSNLIISLPFESPSKEAITMSKLSHCKETATSTPPLHSNSKTALCFEQNNVISEANNILVNKATDLSKSLLFDNILANNPENFEKECMPSKNHNSHVQVSDNTSPIYLKLNFSKKCTLKKVPGNISSTQSHEKFDKQFMSLKSLESSEKVADKTNSALSILKEKNNELNFFNIVKSSENIRESTSLAKPLSPEKFYKNHKLSENVPDNSSSDKLSSTEQFGKEYINLISDKTLLPERNTLPKVLDKSETSLDETNCSKSLASCLPSNKVSILSDELLTNALENYDDFLMPSVSNFGKHNSTRNSINELHTSIYFKEDKQNNVSTLSRSFLNSDSKSSTHEDTTKISSINLTETSTSEYLPDSSVEISKSLNDLNDSVGTTVETSIEIKKNPLNVSAVIVPHRSNKCKKHFCVFCKTLQSKLARHLFLIHKSEKEVKRAFNLPKRCMERIKIIEELRKKGDFMHNTSEDLNSGVLIVSRQQQKNSKNDVKDYACCKNCKGFFSKNTIRIHLKKCGNNILNDRGNLIISKRLTQFVHPAANDIVKTIIFPVLCNDKVTKSIQYDELIMKYANKLSEKYSLVHQHDMIRAQMRYLGRFKIEVMKQKSDIKQLKDIYKPQLYDTCISCLRIVSNWDSIQMRFKTPAVAQSLTTLIKKCGYKQRVELIKAQSNEEQKDLDDFLSLWEEEVPSLINKKALEDQSNQRLNKKVVLPSKDDIRALFSFLRARCLDNMEKLSNKFYEKVWVDLVQTTLVLIQVFNRRRAGEIERLTVDNYNNKEVVTDSVDEEILKDASQETIALAKKYVRISLRGKLGRAVSILLCPLCIAAIELIIKYRSEAGITYTNNYIFARAGNNKLTKQYYRACPILRKMSKECGAKAPENLRGTKLRKHIATYTALINTEEASVEHLANFMGHHKDIHKSIYRVPLPVTEITCISKIFMAAIGEDEYDGKDESEAELEDISLFNKERQNENNEEEQNKDSEENESNSKSGNDESLGTSSSSKQSKRSPFGKTKRIRWSEKEKYAINKAFGDLKELERLPTLPECCKVIRRYPALKKRRPEQLKAFIDNQRRCK